MDESLYRPTDALLSALDGFDSGRDSARDWSEARSGTRETPGRARVTVWESEEQKPRRKAVQPGVNHFGEQLRGHRFGHRMTREFYAYPSRVPHQRPKRERMPESLWESTAWVYRDKERTRLSDLFLLVYRDRALANYDLSMQYFSSLSAGEFESALQAVLSAGRTFKPVESLTDWDEVPGAYVMVFDDYRQFYVGQSRNIRKRIKQHWTGKKSFDRLLHGGVYSSILPVDELRALDTTRIYATKSSDPFQLEQRTEAAADQRFCLNRISGGEMLPMMALLAAIDPRTREHAITATPMTREEYTVIREELDQGLSMASSGLPGLVDWLVGLDLRIYSAVGDDGTQRFWSRRDGVAMAARHGRISAEAYASFLEGIGETVVRLDD